LAADKSKNTTKAELFGFAIAKINRTADSSRAAKRRFGWDGCRTSGKVRAWSCAPFVVPSLIVRCSLFAITNDVLFRADRPAAETLVHCSRPGRRVDRVARSVQAL